MSKKLIKNSQPLGKKIQKTVGGIFWLTLYSDSATRHYWHPIPIRPFLQNNHGYNDFFSCHCSMLKTDGHIIFFWMAFCSITIMNIARCVWDTSGATAFSMVAFTDLEPVSDCRHWRCVFVLVSSFIFCRIVDVPGLLNDVDTSADAANLTLADLCDVPS